MRLTSVCAEIILQPCEVRTTQVKDGTFPKIAHSVQAYKELTLVHTGSCNKDSFNRKLLVIQKVQFLFLTFTPSFSTRYGHGVAHLTGCIMPGINSHTECDIVMVQNVLVLPQTAYKHIYKYIIAMKNPGCRFASSLKTVIKLHISIFEESRLICASFDTVLQRKLLSHISCN